MQGLCVLLKRLAYPCRYFDLMYRFARPVPELCMISNAVLDWIYTNHGHRMTSWNQLFLTPAWLEQYARAIYQMGCPLTNCFGFIDGTVRPISRPDEHQRLVYNGHKCVHSLKFQSLVIPCTTDACTHPNRTAPLHLRRPSLPVAPTADVPIPTG